jgi:hypothetical protein
MKNKYTLVVLLLLALATSFANAQEYYLDKFEQVGDLKVFQSLDDESKWYYLADQIQIAQRNGKPQFSFLKFVTNEDTGSEGGITAAKGGGVVHMLVEFRVSEQQKRKAEQELQRKHPGAAIAGPIIYRSGTFALISATLDEEGEYADKIVGVGRAPVMEGHRAAVSILLSKEGATLLWESFKTDTPDISVNFEMEIKGYREPFEAKVTGNWNLISKHSNLALGLRASMIGLDVQRTVTELRQSNAITVDVKGSDEMGDAMVTQIEGKLVDFIFEKINDPRVLQGLVEDKNLYSNVERANRIYDQNQQRRNNSSGSSSSSSSSSRSRSGSSSGQRQQSSFLQPILLQGKLQVASLNARYSLPGVTLYQPGQTVPHKLNFPNLLIRKAGNTDSYSPIICGLGTDDIQEWGAALQRSLTELFQQEDNEDALRRESRRRIIAAIQQAVDPMGLSDTRYQPTQRFNSLHTITFRDFSDDSARIEHLVEMYFVEARAFQERIESGGDGETRLVLGEAEELPIDEEEDNDQQRLVLGEAERLPVFEGCGDSYNRSERMAFNREVRNIINGGGSNAAKINRITAVMQRELQQHTRQRANLGRLRQNLQQIFEEGCFPSNQQKLTRTIQLMFAYIEANCYSTSEPIVYCGDSLSDDANDGEVMDFSGDAGDDQGEVMDFGDEPLDQDSARGYVDRPAEDQNPTSDQPSDRDRQISKSGPSGSKSGGGSTTGANRSTPASSDDTPSSENQQEQQRDAADQPASGDAQAESGENATVAERAALLSSGDSGDTADRAAALSSGNGGSNSASEQPSSASESRNRRATPRSRSGGRVYDQRQARERGSSFALMAAYRVKRYKTSGTFSFSFNKKMLQAQVVTMAHNVGDLYNRYGNDPAIFKEVNLDDPVYKQREVIVFLDGQDKDAFDKYINYVTVSMRKKHQNGNLTQDELRIDKNNFNNEGNVFRMLYGWKGDANREKWLEYEYKTTWSYHGGFTYESDWQKTSDFNITVTPPHRYRTVKLEADPDILQDEGVRLTTVTFYYKALGREMPPIQVSMRTNPDDLNKTIEYFHTNGIFDYEYELKWRVRGQYVTSGRLKGDEDFIFIDELP